MDHLVSAVHAVSLSPVQSLGIPVSLIGCVLLALGAQYQQRGVAKVSDARPSDSSRTLGFAQLTGLIRRPSWLAGTLLLALSVVFQLVSLYLAPLTVVQPLGALALVITVILTSRQTKTKLSGNVKRAVALCIGGVALFVVVAALTTTTPPLRNLQLLIVLIVLAVVLVGCAITFAVGRARIPRLVYVLFAGVLFGFVATLAKVLIARIQTIAQNGFHLVAADWLTIVCLVGLLLAGLLGSYFQQTAYSTGSPQLVVAGLTVVDPIVGVTIGIAVLGEASTAPLWAGLAFIVAGVVAVSGVVKLSRLSVPAKVAS
jgi:drug/metabolite transporter (DMT)-like permease